MIEPALIFALGVMLASLVALLGAPILGRLAQRRALAILERRMPVSSAEIAAERDQLRAAHAVAIRVLEQRIEALDGRLAAALADAGRQSGRLITFEDRAAHDRAAIATAEQALAEMTRIADAAAVLASSQAALVLDTTTLADRRGHELEIATQRVAELEALLADQRVLMDDAARRPAWSAPAGSEGRVTDDGVQLRAANIRLKNEQEVLFASVAAATRERDRLRLQNDESLLRIDVLQEAAEEASDYATAERQLAVKQAKKIAALEKRVAGRDETIAGLKRRLTEAQARRAVPQATELPLFAEGGSGETEPRDPAALRQAVAALAADIVRFATPTSRAAPPK